MVNLQVALVQHNRRRLSQRAESSVLQQRPHNLDSVALRRPSRRSQVCLAARQRPNQPKLQVYSVARQQPSRLSRVCLAAQQRPSRRSRVCLVARQRPSRCSRVCSASLRLLPKGCCLEVHSQPSRWLRPETFLAAVYRTSSVKLDSHFLVKYNLLNQVSSSRRRPREASPS